MINVSSLILAQDLQSLVNSANNKIKSGDLKSAETLLQNVLDFDPSYAPALISFSKIWLHKGSLARANEHATLAVRINEEFRPWWDELNAIKVAINDGQKYVQKGNFNKAYSAYEAIFKKYPYYSQAYYFMGVAKYKQKDLEGAALSFENALKIYPDYQKAKKALNNVKKRLKK